MSILEKRKKKIRIDKIELESCSYCSEQQSHGSYDSKWNSNKSSLNKEKKFLKEIHAYDESEKFNSYKKKSTNESEIEKALNLLNNKTSKRFEKK